MINKVCVAILLSLAMAVPQPARAQDMPAGKWWYNPKVVKALNLTDREVRQIDRLYADNRRQLIDLKGRVEREQLELDTLLGSKSTDDQAVKRQFQRLETARAELSNARLGFVLGVRDIIGHERFQQLKASYRDWQ